MFMKKQILWIVMLVLALSTMWVGIASAQQPTPSDDEVNAIARQLFCPVCENTPLDICPTQACKQWRDLIRQMLAEGKSEEYIKQYFVDNYGARVLSEPPQTGINWLVYIIPPVAFLAGSYLLFQAFWNWRRVAKELVADSSTRLGAGAGPGSDPVTDDEYVARLEEELRKRQ
jgi:cytochrome c-type biogenesis protein CcmH